MRRKPAQQGANPNYGNNQQRSHKPRSFGGGGGSGGGQQYNRPRKNYGQMREKYLGQARDAMAAGDRVLAENYLQHADHCYRMLMEENQNRPQPRPAQVQNEQVEQSDDAGNVQSQPEGEEEIMSNNSALPAFLTGGFEHAAVTSAENPAPAQDWEERDSQ